MHPRFANALVFIFKFRSPLKISKHKRPRRHQRLRRPIKISPPIVHESLQLNINAAAVMSESNARPDSGVFYLVTNKAGGKSIVRRPARPPPSPLLPDDFGVYTQGGTTLKGAQMAPGPSKRPNLALRTSSPVERRSLVSVQESEIPKAGRFDPIRAFRKSFRTKTQPDPLEPPLSTDLPGNWKGKDRAVELSQEDPKANRISSKAKEIRAWMMGKSGSDIHRSATYPLRQPEKFWGHQPDRKRQTTPSNGTVMKSPTFIKDDRSRGPRPGQAYEMVNRQIIENNQEKTVELSTWREQAPGRMRPDDAERISVYYISADEYAQDTEGNGHAHEIWRSEETDGSRHIALSPFRDCETSYTTNRTHKRLRSQKLGPHPPPSTRRDGTISPSTSEKEASSGVGQLPSTKPLSHLSPPTMSPVSTKRTPVLLPQRNGRRYKESTPIVSQSQPRSPFHPTQSGSTISSIKSDSTSAYEAVLESCEPSLLHISPMLKSLGIRTVEHLKAVARLTPNIRDREVKDDALRLGITVMEWAILIDKLLSL